MNQRQLNQTSHLILYTLCITFKSVCSSIVSMTRIHTGRYGVQILAGAREPHLHNIQTSSSAHPTSNLINNHSLFSGSKVARADSLTTLTFLQPVYKSVELNLHSTCLPPWRLLGQIYFTSTSYLCTYKSQEATSFLAL
jgi:hypothetical protein